MTRGDRNIRWIESYCRIPEGKFVGKPVRLTSHQRSWLKMIYDTPTRTFILSIPRKNAKTALSAFILLLHLAGPESRHNGQLYSAAQSRDQAGLIFQLASKIIRMSPDLSQFISIRDTAKQLFCAQRGTLYRALSAEAATAYGLSPTLAIHDELGQVIGPRSELYEAIETACAAQEEPLSIIISTQAPTDNDLLSILIDDAKTNSDPRIKCVVYSAPIESDPFVEETIRAANPHYDEFMNKEEVLSQAQSAKRMPSKEASYRNLILNQRVAASSPFVAKTVWDACGGTIPEDVLERGKIFLGLDLSIRSDLSALVATIPDGDDWYVKCWFFTPEVGLAERAKRDRTPWDLWVEKGYIIATPGATVDYDYIVGILKDIHKQGDIAEIAYDRYRIDDLNAALSRADLELPLVEFGQGFVSMAPAIDALESHLMNGRIRHGNHPVLKMCAANAVVSRDAAGNRKFDKAKATGKIDGLVAMTMSVGIADKSINDCFDADVFEPIKVRAR